MSRDRKHFFLDEPVKRIILEFLGDKTTDCPHQIQPTFNADRLREKTSVAKAWHVEKILGALEEFCSSEAEVGNTRADVRYRQLAEINEELKDIYPSDRGSETESRAANYWWWLMGFLPTLEEEMRKAGFTIRLAQPWVKAPEETCADSASEDSEQSEEDQEERLVYRTCPLYLPPRSYRDPPDTSNIKTIRTEAQPVIDSAAEGSWRTDPWRSDRWTSFQEETEEKPVLHFEDNKEESLLRIFWSVPCRG